MPGADLSALPYGRIFDANHLLQISMPMGGIGTGSVSLGGNGALLDLSVWNRPQFTAWPERHATLHGGFAVLHIKGNRPDTRIVEGPMPPERIYDQGLKAQGYRNTGHEGLPRFADASFRAAYPFGEVSLADPNVPLSIRLTGWNPLIPLDDKNSSIPCAILDYQLTNTSSEPVEYEFSYHLSHLALGAGDGKNSRNAVMPDAGAYLYNVESDRSALFGSVSLSVAGFKPQIKAMWLRGAWFDWISALWRELSSGAFRPNLGNADRSLAGHNGASVLLSGRLAPGESITYPIILTWYFPNVHYDVTSMQADTCGADCGCHSCEPPKPKWRPYYVSQWQNAGDVAAYVRRNYASLRTRTRAFADALFSSTLPPAVTDAVASNLAILKSPTVLRQENGRAWAWEGCFCDAGCCSGTCTHVWNYAQAMPHLFPKLERGLRETELEYSMDDAGHVNFRSALPDGPTDHRFHAAADGQLGGILKLYRDWQISGDTNWMKKLYPLAKRSLAYGIQQWDPNRRGALFEPHHNTYDIEFWGPDGMCTSIYIGALCAIAEMGDVVKDPEAQQFRELAARGADFMNRELFNGEYYQQKIVWQDARDQSFAKKINDAASYDAEELRILKEEGPKYQYGSGCLSDGVIGAWMSDLYGVRTPLSQEHVASSLAAIFRHNFKPDMWGHACTQRPGYAMGHEPGLLICTWPRGGHPTFPFVYSDEIWTGIEYQVASHLIMAGMVQEGLTIVEAARSRYEGHVRNPFNEYECGSYYARAMASYALIPALSGFRYSAVHQTLEFAPKQNAGRFSCFFSTASAFGTISLSGSSVEINVIEGSLTVATLRVQSSGATTERPWNTTITAGKPQSLSLH